MQAMIRTADPWRDTDVVDEHAARFAQGTTGIVALLGVVFGWPLAWALMSAQLLIGVTLGRRFCLPCVAYFVLIQPRFGEGPLEDSRPAATGEHDGNRLSRIGGRALVAGGGAGGYRARGAGRLPCAPLGEHGILRRLRDLPVDGAVCAGSLPVITIASTRPT